jgi:paraquat-inducible protein B
MSKRANPAAVGGFVLGAMALAVAGVVFFGGGSFFADTERYVIFFDGSVNGLQVGSPVKLVGVPIGEVIQVRAIADVEDWQVYTETIVQIDRARFARRGKIIGGSLKRAEQLVGEGARARLDLQSFITGQLYVSLDILPDTEVNLKGGDTRYPEIPAIPSRSQELEGAFREVMAKLKDVDLEKLFANVESAVAGLDRLINESKLDEAIANLDATLEEAHSAVADARHLMQSLDNRIDPVSTSAMAALDETRATMSQARSTLASVDGLVEPGSPNAYEMSMALKEVTAAARAIRLLATFLEENPNSVVFGRSAGGQ